MCIIVPANRRKSMNDPLNMGKTTVLAVGEDFHLKLGKDRIVYAGMPSEDVFSIIQVKTSGYRGYAWHLYFPRGKHQITIDGVPVYVERVDAEEISIRV
jgi:hypothetical protein